MKQSNLPGLLLKGAGAGILLTLGLTWNQLSSFHLDLYHRQLPIITVIRAIAIDVALVSLLGALVVWLLRCVDAQSRSILWAFFAAALLARAVGGLISAEVLTRQDITPVHVFALIFVLCAILWWIRRSWYSTAMRVFEGLLLLVGVSIFWVVPQLLWLGLQHQPSDKLAFATNVPAQPLAHRRVVWMLFDEASYDQIFDHRQSGLSMPNFDSFRARSIGFSDVTPDGYFTEEVLPSLLMGQPVDEIRSSTGGNLIYRNAASSPWKTFDPETTLFADAHRMHLTTGLVSSYNPYCRLLPQQLDSCWTQLLLFGDHLSGAKSTFENVAAPVYATLARTFHRPLDHTPTDAEKFQSLMKASEDLLGDDNIDFVLIHLPVPHPPGIYQRSTGRTMPGGSYIDNLALADDTLGKLQAAIDKTALASQTTVIVSSDHSWRVLMWRNAIGWTAEDERASQGKFDTRPVLMVHLPQETQGETISQPFPALKEHDMIENLLKADFTPDSLKTWADAQH